jgi:hypothetical protein
LLDPQRELVQLSAKALRRQAEMQLHAFVLIVGASLCLFPNFLFARYRSLQSIRFDQGIRRRT